MRPRTRPVGRHYPNVRTDDQGKLVCQTISGTQDVYFSRQDERFIAITTGDSQARDASHGANYLLWTSRFSVTIRNINKANLVMTPE
ncbi:hypothetical protein F5X98DRAFT_329053 [Xylaria grammica]|nr:hypothetical protein F5X98DRAFT_329053 [Xylaria grammica]